MAEIIGWVRVSRASINTRCNSCNEKMGKPDSPDKVLPVYDCEETRRYTFKCYCCPKWFGSGELKGFALLYASTMLSIKPEMRCTEEEWAIISSVLE
jgi:hypothetical protein